MTRKQKLIVVGLAVANALLILTVAAFFLRRPTGRGAEPGPVDPTRRSPTATAPTPTPLAEAEADDCTWLATRMLAAQHLAGVVRRPAEDTLRFELQIHPPADQAPAQSAQKVWEVFDAALLIEEQGTCSAVEFIEVSIRSRATDPPFRIDAHARLTDLVAFDAQAITEDELIDRVTYTIVEPADR
jgi:hypothetical protein